MRPISALALGFVLAHGIAIAVLHWPQWGLGLLALPCWGLAAVGAGEPRPTKSARHFDVRDAERTELGRMLMYREGWIIERPALALGVLAVLSQLVVGVVLALTPAEETPLQIARACVWAPAVLTAGGFILANMVNIWAVSGTLVLLWLIFVVASAVEGGWALTSRLVAGAAVVVAALFCVDLLRGARRGLERARSSSEPKR